MNQTVSSDEVFPPISEADRKDDRRLLQAGEVLNSAFHLIRTECETAAKILEKRGWGSLTTKLNLPASLRFLPTLILSVSWQLKIEADERLASD